MVENKADELETLLKKFVDKDITIIQEGFVQNKFYISKMNYTIKKEILNCIDEKNNIYLKINTNQIYVIENKKDEIKIYLDNDTIVKIQKDRQI